MKYLMIILFFFPLPALAADTPFSGIWQVDGSVAGYTVNRTCKFKQDGNKLSGTCQNSADQADDKILVITGGVQGKSVSWKYDADWNGSTLTATYTGAWDGDASMTGTIDVQPVNAAGTFTAKKDK